MVHGLEHQKQAVNSGYWPLYRYNPQLKEQGKNPLQLDSKAPTFDFEEYAYSENRYRALRQTNPDAAQRLMKLAKADAAERFAFVEQLSRMKYGSETTEADSATSGSRSDREGVEVGRA
jgi:pyruvate-ferredoxin/flavodoxin oxidoreductase